MSLHSNALFRVLKKAIKVDKSISGLVFFFELLFLLKRAKIIDATVVGRQARFMTVFRGLATLIEGYVQ